jgi:uncharacterized protein YjbI with pentapeptide repeats
MTMRQRTVGMLILAVLFAAALYSCIAVLPAQIVRPLTAAQLNSIGSQQERITLQDDRIGLENSVRTTLLQGLAGAFLIVTAYLSWRGLMINREAQATERYIQGVNQLGSEQLSTRIGGIYGLGRVADESAIDERSVRDVLAAFVRSRAPWPPSDLSRKVVLHSTTPADVEQASQQILDEAYSNLSTVAYLRTRCPDVQAALTVLGMLGHAANDAGLELRGVDLRKADLRGIRLRNVYLGNCVLWASMLDKADLRDADFSRARLRDATLIDCRLDGANLSYADLRGATLTHASFRNADLRNADLRGALFDMSQLDGAKVDNIKTDS